MTGALVLPGVDPVIRPLLYDLRDCLAHEISKVASPPAVTCIRPGDRVELLLSTERDECCEGLAWVRYVNDYPSQDFPAQDVTFQRCMPMQYAVVVELGVARCAPRPGANEIPECEEWTAVNDAVMDDGAAIRRAILCCFWQLKTYKDRPLLLGLAEPISVEGGCVGIRRQVTIAVPPCDPCD